jgi:hypothetical protein
MAIPKDRPAELSIRGEVKIARRGRGRGGIVALPRVAGEASMPPWTIDAMRTESVRAPLPHQHIASLRLTDNSMLTRAEVIQGLCVQGDGAP